MEHKKNVATLHISLIFNYFSCINLFMYPFAIFTKGTISSDVTLTMCGFSTAHV